MDVRELRNKAAHYRKLAAAEPLGEMRDMLMRVVASLEEAAAAAIRVKSKKKPRR